MELAQSFDLHKVLPIEQEWSSLADITSDPLDRNRKIPEERIKVLEQVFDGRRITQAASAVGPAGTLGMLVSNTTIIVKLAPLMLNLAKAVVGSMAFLYLEEPISRGGGGLTAAESLSKLKTCFSRLDPDAGQMCTYTAVVRAGSDVQRDIGMRPATSQVFAEHAEFRPTCKQTSCKFHRSGACGIRSSELDQVIAGLKQDGILTAPSDGHLWVTL